MANKVVRDILVADSAVTALVGVRISPLIKAQGVTPPAITISRESLSPNIALDSDTGLDANRVRVDSWAESYVSALAIASACRTALGAQGIYLDSEFDNFDPGIDPGLYNVTQVYLVWT